MHVRLISFYKTQTQNCCWSLDAAQWLPTSPKENAEYEFPYNKSIKDNLFVFLFYF